MNLFVKSAKDIINYCYMIDATVKSAEDIVSSTTIQSMQTSSVFLLNNSMPFLSDVSEEMVDNNASINENNDDLVENQKIASLSNVTLLSLSQTKLSLFADNRTDAFNTSPYNDDPADISHSTDQSSGDNTFHSSEKPVTHSDLHSSGHSSAPTTSHNAETITMHSILSISDLHTRSSTFYSAGSSTTSSTSTFHTTSSSATLSTSTFHNTSSSTTSNTSTFHNTSSSTTSSTSTFHNTSSSTTSNTSTFHSAGSSTTPSTTQYAVSGESKLIAVGLQVNGNIAICLK